MECFHQECELTKRSLPGMLTALGEIFAHYTKRREPAVTGKINTKRKKQICFAIHSNSSSIIYMPLYIVQYSTVRTTKKYTNCLQNRKTLLYTILSFILKPSQYIYRHMYLNVAYNTHYNYICM